MDRHPRLVDGLFECVDPDAGPQTTTGGLQFHEATDLSPHLLARLQHTVRTRVLRLIRYCARPPFALELLDRFANLFPPPRIHRHRYHGVFAPNAPLTPLVTVRVKAENKAVADESLSLTPLLPQTAEPKKQDPDPLSRPGRDSSRFSPTPSPSARFSPISVSPLPLPSSIRHGLRPRPPCHSPVGP